MIEVIKKGIFYLLVISVALLVTFIVAFIDRFQLEPKEVYRVYLDGKVLGNILDKQELEDYINDEQKELKEKFDVKKVYVPTGVDIKKYTTYEKEVLTAKQINTLIKKEKPFTIKGYKITLKPTSEEEEKIVINVLEKEMFDTAIKAVLEAFITSDEIKNFENSTQPEIKETGSIIEDIYIDQDITIKEDYISVDEQIFTDVKTLTKYLLFGEVKEEQYYTVKEGDTIDSIAYDHKLATAEFLIVNPEFTSANSLISPGQQVKVGLINPVLDVVVVSHTVSDQESQYKTVTQYDASMSAGAQKVITEGQNGINRMTMKIKYVNGEIATLTTVSSETITPSVDKVVKVGTKVHSGGGTPAIMTGSWAWPTISKYYISSYFGYRWGKLHEAIDIAGSGEGSPIFAAGSGTVIAAVHNAKSLGHYVTINHNNGIYTIYGHMRNLTVKEGQTVQKGQQIGTMGHTGFSTGTHLHFGVYKNGIPYRGGTPINPLSLYK